MSTWRTVRPFLAVLVVGILVGVIGAMFLGGDDDQTDRGDDPTTTTTETPTTDPPPPIETSTTTAADSSSSTSSTSSTTSSSTSTSVAPAAAPLADATTGDLVGFAMGSPMDVVEAALVALHGPPGTDTGWSTGCLLDGNDALDERLVWWGDLRVRFVVVDGAEVTGGWVYGDPAPEPTPPPSPDDPDGTGIVMPPGVAWGQSIAEVAAAIGVPTDDVADVQETFLLTWIYDDAGEARWLAPGVDLDAPFTEVSWRADDICD